MKPFSLSFFLPSVLLLAGCMTQTAYSFRVVAPSIHSAARGIQVDQSSGRRSVILADAAPSGESSDAAPSGESPSPTPLCDLQTFLKVTNSVDSGGEAKTVIQGGICYLNGEPELRRAKKLFPGDEVFFDGTSMDVSTEIKKYDYVYKPKKKKVKPVAKVDADGNLEFGGRYRSEEWRAERKERKAQRKSENKE